MLSVTLFIFSSSVPCESHLSEEGFALQVLFGFPGAVWFSLIKVSLASSFQRLL